MPLFESSVPHLQEYLKRKQKVIFSRVQIRGVIWLRRLHSFNRCQLIFHIDCYQGPLAFLQVIVNIKYCSLWSLLPLCMDNEWGGTFPNYDGRHTVGYQFKCFTIDKEDSWYENILILNVIADLFIYVGCFLWFNTCNNIMEASLYLTMCCKY